MVYSVTYSSRVGGLALPIIMVPTNPLVIINGVTPTATYLDRP